MLRRRSPVLLLTLAGWLAGAPADRLVAAAPEPGFARAWRDPEPDLNLAPLAKVTVSSSQLRGDARLDPAALVDRRFGTDSLWAADPATPGRPWVGLEFPAPRRLRAARLYRLPGRAGLPDRFPAFRLLAENEAGSWTEVFASAPDDGAASVNATIYAGRTLEFSPVTARRWRLEARHERAALSLREIEVFEEVPAFRTPDREPGDTRIRLRESQQPTAAVQRGETVLWATGSMEKVFRDDRLAPPTTTGPGPIVLRAARGETEAFQVVWWEAQGAEQVRASVEGWSGPGPGIERWVSIHPVAYVYCRVASTDLRLTVQGLDRFHGPGFYPEVLLPDRPVAAPAGRQQPFWISVAVPRDAVPGTYRARVTVRSGRESLTLPLELVVWDFALPAPADFAVRNVFTFLGYDAKARAQHCPDEATAQAYWRSLRQAAANMPGADFSSLEPAPVRRDASDRLSFDWAPFDRQVEWLRQELGARHFILPFGYLAYHGELYAPAGVLGPGVKPGTERWFGLLEQALTQYVGHLRDRGWLGEFSFFVYDEPDNTLLPTCRRLVALARRVTPTLPLILHSHPWTPEMMTLDATAVLNPRHFPQPFVQRLQARGWTVWTYCNGASLIDGPPHAGRMIPWLYFKYGITGMTWHSLDDWRGTSPWEAPDRYLSWNASSCFLFPDPAEPTRALRTIRWEQWRDGMEDYEFLRRLRDAAAATRDAGLRAEAAALLEQASAVAGRYGYTDDLSDEQVFVATTRPRSAVAPERRAALNQLRPGIEYEERPEVIAALRQRMGDLIVRLGR